MNVISIVGVSVLHNYQHSYQQDLKRIFAERHKADYFDASLQEKNHKKISSLQNYIVAKFKEGEGALSAEIVSLIKLQEDVKEPLSVALFCTDTNESYFAALCIEKYFEFFSNRQIHIQTIEVVGNLSIIDKPTFDIGLNNLLQTIINAIGEPKECKNLIINITAGYKILIPHLALIGQIFKIRLVYLFDDGVDDKDGTVDFKTKNLLNAPELPMYFDWKFLEPYLELIKKFNEPKSSVRFKEEYFRVKKYIEDGWVKISESQISKTKLGFETLGKEPLSINNKLISFVNDSIKYGFLDNQLCLTPIAKLIFTNKKKRPADNGFLGFAMEAFLKSYFMLPAEKKDQTVQFYSLALNFNQKKQYFRITDLQNKQIELSESEQIEIGDIDVPLLNTKNNTIVLCEVKALTAFEKYYEKIDKEGDYYFQLKARAMAYLTTNPNSTVEILLLIYQFQIEGFEEDLSKEIYDKEKKYHGVLSHLVTLEQDNDLKGLVVFKTVVLQKIQERDLFGATAHLFNTELKFNIFTQIDFNKL